MGLTALRTKILASLGVSVSALGYAGCHQTLIGGNCNPPAPHDETPIPGCTVHLTGFEHAVVSCISVSAMATTCPTPAEAQNSVQFGTLKCADGGPMPTSGSASTSSATSAGSTSGAGGASSSASSSGSGFGTGAQCCYIAIDNSFGCTGRPFTVDGASRVALVVSREGWTGKSRNVSLGEAPPRHAGLAEAWARDAVAEHASIASFARFVQELLAFGAPADLVRRATRAMADEIAHAEDCFALATRFGGAAVGPGSLATHDAPPATDLASAVRATIIEGCIGETISAICAEHALTSTTDVEVRRVLEKIVRDESRHAELAFRFVAWAIDRGGESIRSVAQEELARARRASQTNAEPETAQEKDADLFRACGRISATDRRRTAEKAWSEVLLPCAEALFARNGRTNAAARAVTWM